MIDPAAPRPQEPGKRPQHHLHKAINHHRAHRKRVQAQAEAHFEPPAPNPAAP